MTSAPVFFYINSKLLFQIAEINQNPMQKSDMELLLLSSLLLISLILSLSLRILYSKKPNNPSKFPPGQTGWPVVGETLEFLSAGRKGTPEKFFNERMSRFSPQIFTTSLLGEKTAVLCGAAGNKFLFSNENKLVTSWWPRSVEKIFPTSLQTSTREESIKMRNLLPGFLKPDALQKYVGVMDSIARRHLDTFWDSGEQITVLPLAKKYTFAVACRLFLSIDDPKQIAKFEKPFHVLVAGVLSVPVNLPGTPFNRAIRAANLIRNELLEIIKQRKREMVMEKMGNRGDILGHMLTTRDESGRFMSEPDIADKIIGLLIGGHDTASAAITFIIKYLAELPEIYENVLKEQREIAEGKAAGEMLKWEELQKMKYSWNVACEVMRLAPPLQGNFREAITDFTYAGFFIPKGWKLYWTANSTHKNPEYFREAEKFDPSRFEEKGPIPFSYVPFGGGPRMCPGKEYARLEILTFMHNIVLNFKWEKAIPNEKMVVDPMPMPANGLPIRINRRHPSNSY